MAERRNQLMIMSIRPRFVADFLSGDKTVELRRTRPLVGPGQPVAIYSTTPVAELTALAVVDAVIETSPTSLWTALGSATGLTRREFRDYFRGCRTAVAIHLTDVRALSAPVPLNHMRSNARFQPPQTWNFLGEGDVRQLLHEHPALHETLTCMAPPWVNERVATG